MRKLTDLVHNGVYNLLQSFAMAFGLENGKKQLTEYFEDVKLVKYDNRLEVREAEPLVIFCLSSSYLIQDKEIQDFIMYIAKIIENKGKNNDHKGYRHVYCKKAKIITSKNHKFFFIN